MTDSHRAPKQWCLSKHEDINSFDRWRQNLLYTLTLDEKFSAFLTEDATWEKKSKNNQTRGLTNDPTTVPTEKRRTAQQKAIALEMMLGQIANFCPVIARNTIIRTSTSLSDIWQTIRLHYGFQSSGAHFLDMADIRLEADERPEDLYQRLMSFVDDNLLQKNDKIKHHGETPTEDEEITPTVENVVILLWLQLIHKDLPKTVQQRYGTELREKTLASIKPEISKSLGHMLTLIRSNDDAKVFRTDTGASNYSRSRPTRFNSRSNNGRRQRVCSLCKQAGRQDTDHFLSSCRFLPESDRKYMAKARQIVNIIDEEEEGEVESEEEQEPHVALRIQVRQSPYIDAFYKHHPIRVTIDSGATGNMIRASTAERLGVKVSSSSQSAHQADGASPLIVVGETRFTVYHNNRPFKFEGLVVENLDVDILGGTPFMETNDISIRPAKRSIIFSDGEVYTYGSGHTSASHKIRLTHVVRAPPENTTVWPGEFIEVSLPETYPDSEYALEPRYDTSVAPSHGEMWPHPTVVHSIGGKVRIPNLTTEPLTVKRNTHFCQVLPLCDSTEAKDVTVKVAPVVVQKSCAKPPNFSNDVKIDPDDTFPSDMKQAFTKLVEQYDHVFNPNFKGYNGSSGKFEAMINMGPVQPPQRKGRVPQYARDKLQELQEQFDQLEGLGVFKKPEEVGINVEYINPSFLVDKKASKGHRLVTAFADVGRYSKPQPALMPDVDSTLRQIAQLKYIVTTDLSKAFYQIPLSKESMKYCGVATPFRGVRVYVRSAMGMPGSEVALEELMCRIFGDLLHEGVIAKIADDFYCGGNDLKELYNNWSRVLQLLDQNGLCISAPKTVIGPKSTVVLGWLWQNGTIQATSHRTASLASCSPPQKVTDMRSFIGAFKVLSRVLPNCASYISPLDKSIAGKQSKDSIEWNDDLRDAFKLAQEALKKTETIILPRENDQLWIVTDGSVKMQGIGATMYVRRDDKLRLAGFFSAKLRDRQVLWLPCEIEALGIAVATKHFSPYIVQSKFNTTILTDSKPCVQAFEKLCRGEFSASPRVSTFLSVVSRYQASVRHIAGEVNLPSDHASRHPAICENEKCQVCSFVARTEDSVVRNINVQDIIQGKVRVPYTSRTTWATTQADCKDLRRTKAHLKQGTRPSKKLTKIRDVKRYLQVATLARDGLLVVKRSQELAPDRECIIVPRQVLPGILNALHIQLDHPTEHQFKQVLNRSFFALDMNRHVEQLYKSCHTCSALANVPTHSVEQSRCVPPEAVGSTFAADIMRRERQCILVLRECVSSYTLTCHVTSEQHDVLRDAIIRLIVELRPLDGPPAVIRVDPAPGFRALYNDEELRSHRISLELGRIKNVPNKNPVAEKAIRELRDEIVRICPREEPLSSKQLAVITANLNSRIRASGLSAREVIYQRDQFSNEQIPLKDHDLIVRQHNKRMKNHPHSEKSKAPRAQRAKECPVEIGDIVYLHNDRNKNHTRNRYLVVKVDSDWCYIKKFVGSQLRDTAYRVKRTECYTVQGPLSSQDRIESEEEAFEEIQYSSSHAVDSIASHTESDGTLMDSVASGVEDNTQVSNEQGSQVVHEQDIIPNEIIDPVDSDLDPTDNDIVVDSDSNDQCQVETEVRRSARVRNPPAWHSDFVK